MGSRLRTLESHALAQANKIRNRQCFSSLGESITLKQMIVNFPNVKLSLSTNHVWIILSFSRCLSVTSSRCCLSTSGPCGTLWSNSSCKYLIFFCCFKQLDKALPVILLFSNGHNSPIYSASFWIDLHYATYLEAGRSTSQNQWIWSSCEFVYFFFFTGATPEGWTTRTSGRSTMNTWSWWQVWPVRVVLLCLSGS